MATRAQSYEHHAKIVFGYHRVLTGIVLLLLAWHGYCLFTDFTIDRLAMVALVVAVAAAALYGRAFALGVQDRVIRLEERLRMERLLPEDMQPQIPSFTTEQLIGLRFASDAELPELARRVLAERISDRKSIKAAIRDWRPDDQRV